MIFQKISVDIQYDLLWISRYDAIVCFSQFARLFLAVESILRIGIGLKIADKKCAEDIDCEYNNDKWICSEFPLNWPMCVHLTAPIWHRLFFDWFAAFVNRVERARARASIYEYNATIIHELNNVLANTPIYVAIMHMFHCFCLRRECNFSFHSVFAPISLSFHNSMNKYSIKKSS